MKTKNLRSLNLLNATTQLYVSKCLYHWREYGEQLLIEMFCVKGRTQYFVSFEMPKDIDSYDEESLGVFLWEQIKEFGVKR